MISKILRGRKSQINFLEKNKTFKIQYFMKVKVILKKN